LDEIQREKIFLEREKKHQGKPPKKKDGGGLGTVIKNGIDAGKVGKSAKVVLQGEAWKNFPEEKGIRSRLGRTGSALLITKRKKNGGRGRKGQGLKNPKPAKKKG